MLTYLKIYIIVMIAFSMGWAPLYWMATRDLKRHIGPRFYAAFAVTMLAGLFSPNAFLFFAVMGVAFLATVRSREEALCRYVLMIGLTPFVFWPVAIGSAYLTVVDTVSALGGTALVAIWLKGRRTNEPFRWSAELTAIILIYLIGLAGDRQLQPSIVLRNVTSQALLLLLPYCVLRYGIRNTRDMHVAIACLGASAVVLGVITLVEVRTNWLLMSEVSKHLGDSDAISQLTMRRGRFLRAAGPMTGALMLGSYMTLALTALLCCRRYFRADWAFYAALCVGFLGLLTPQSRGSLGSFFVIGLIGAILMRKWVIVGIATIGGLVGGLTIAVLARTSLTIGSFLGVGAGGGGGDVYDYRQILFQRGLQEGLRHPFFGSDMKRVLDSLADITQGQHIVDMVNIYLSFFLTAGLMGLVPLVICFLMILGKALRRARRPDREMRQLQFFAVGSFLAILFEFSFISLMDRVPYMLAVALIATGTYARARKQRRMVREEEGVAPRRAEETSRYVLPAPVLDPA